MKNVPTVTSPVSEIGATQALAMRIGEIDFARLPPSVIAVARHCVLDWVAVALRATSEPIVRILTEQVLEEGGKAQATLVGLSSRVSVRQAAFVNGAAAHALDYDDVNIRMTGHPTAAVLPGVLALAEASKASGKELLGAFAAGYETVCLVGAMVSPSHYAQGFHVTGTVGTFGSAAACAKLLKLDQERVRVALGIAATQAAGLKSMFGSMCKPMHAGKASESGLLAAQLASRGFTARLDALECPDGFAATQSSAMNAEVMTAEAARFNLPDNLFKYHASCFQTHAAIEGIRSLRKRHRFTGADVAQVTIRQDAGADSVCNIAAPTSGLQTKFSLRMLAAHAIEGLDTADIDIYTDENARNPVLVALKDKVRVVFEPHWPITRSEVRIHLNDGRLLTSDLDSGTPDADLERQERRLIEKLHSLVDARAGAQQANKVADTILSLEHLPDVSALTELLRPISQ